MGIVSCGLYFAHEWSQFKTITDPALDHDEECPCPPVLAGGGAGLGPAVHLLVRGAAAARGGQPGLLRLRQRAEGVQGGEPADPEHRGGDCGGPLVSSERQAAGGVRAGPGLRGAAGRGRAGQHPQQTVQGQVHPGLHPGHRPHLHWALDTGAQPGAGEQQAAGGPPASSDLRLLCCRKIRQVQISLVA